MAKSTKIAIAGAGVALLGAVGAGVANAGTVHPSHSTHTAVHTASASAGEKTSACRPGNTRGRITPDAGSAGHRHYRVTVTAAPNTLPCKLKGSPEHVVFYKGDSPLGVNAGTYGDQSKTVTLRPGGSVHFDIQVPDSSGPAKGNRVDFTLRAPGGVIPGEQVATGAFGVDAGTRIGPVQAGR